MRAGSRAAGLVSQVAALAAPLRTTLSTAMPTQSSATPARGVSFETRKRQVVTEKRVVASIPAPIVPVKVDAAADAPSVVYQHPMPQFHDPLRPTVVIPNSELFAVININGQQFKVAQGDLVMANRIRGVEVGDQLQLDQVLLVGSRDFSVIGRPFVTDAKVLVTVEEQTHLQPRNIFHMRRRTGFHDMKRYADLITVLRVDSVAVEGAPAARPVEDIAPAVKIHAKENTIAVKIGGRNRPTIAIGARA